MLLYKQCFEYLKQNNDNYAIFSIFYFIIKNYYIFFHFEDAQRLQNNVGKLSSSLYLLPKFYI